MMNRRFYNRVRGTQSRILHRLAGLNEVKSKQIAKDVKFRGTLVSSISLVIADSLKVRVIASAPHAYGIEEGIPEDKGWVSFSQHPLLEAWVRGKLISLDKEKAEFFLRRKAVLVGEHGYPYGYPQGIRFMKLGYEHTVSFSNKIIAPELKKLGC